MADDVKHSSIWALAMVLILGSLIWGTAWHSVSTTRAAMENGYSKRTLTGASGTHWVKEVKE